MLRLALTMICAFVVPFNISIASAETLTVEGSVKSVDPAARTITITRKSNAGDKISTLELDRSAVVTVDGKPSQLEAIQPGQQVAISYNSELELVTKILAFKQGAVPPEQRKVELVQISELGVGRSQMPFWITDDTLTIYWEAWQDGTSMIWSAKRESPTSLFTEPKTLFKGRHPTVSKDGLEMILLGPRTDGQNDTSLHVATRESIDKPFGRPTEIRELRTVSLSPKNPCLSADGLTLYFNMPSGGNGSECLQSRRIARTAAWGKPTPIPFVARNGASSSNWISMSDDGLTLFCAEEGAGAKENPQGNLMIWRRTDKTKPFSQHEYISPQGLPVLTGRCPRYIAATNELYFSRSAGKAWTGIWVVKGLESTAVSK